MMEEKPNQVPISDQINNWEGVITNFLADKYEADFAKYVKEVFKNLGSAYEKGGFLKNDELAFIFDSRKTKKVVGQKDSEFILGQINLVEATNEKPDSINFESLITDIQSKQQELVRKYEPETWISWAAENAKNVTFATHVAKLTHSSIDSPSFFNEITATRNSYLSTSSLIDVAIDGAVKGNQYSPIYQFLELELNHKKLAGEFVNLDSNLLKNFANNQEQMLLWNRGFSSATSHGKPKAHFLLKQTYFPVNKDYQNKYYHLLCNVVSSSKAQSLFEFSRRNSKNTLKLRNSKKYSKEHFFNFPNKASISITASNPGNASQLNGKRGGRLILYSSQPPVWHSQLKPPIYKTNFFYELSKNYEVKENIQYLSDFLSRFESLQLSIKDPKRMRWLEQWVENLVDEVLVYVKTIQDLPAGWSDIEEVKLKSEHQVLLDCHRQDEEFSELKNSGDWQAVVIQDFANWLNNRITMVNEQFTPQDSHTELWKKIFITNFRQELDIAGLTQQEKTV